MRRESIPGLTPLRTWATINDREAERVKRIEQDFQQRQVKLQQQQAEAAERRETLTQAEQVNALFGD